jgi:hypothetical protein
MELFKNTLYINLESRKDRLLHITNELEKMKINGERVNAVKTAVGAIGCTLSHIRCIELAKQRNYEWVFICEDDISFLNPEVLMSSAKSFYENKEINWDVLIIGGNNVPPYQQISDYCVRISNCQTTTGYVVKQHFYDTLIQNFKESATNLLREPTRGNIYALDIYWKRLQSQNQWYMLIPPTVTQYESYSDIENRNVNYNHLMLDMNKDWLFNRR